MLACLNDKELIELVKIAKRIEKHYGCPQDIEWAIDHDLQVPDNIFIVQSRPETIWSQKANAPKLGSKSAFEMLMDKALHTVKVSD